MRNQSKGYFGGVVLLAIGLLLLARTLGWFHINWGDVLNLWPFLLIAAGLSLILGRGQSWSGPLTAILIAIAIPSAIISKASNKWERFKDDVGIDIDNDDDEADDTDYKNGRGAGSNGYFSEALPSGIQTAELHFEGGAGKFKIEGTSDKLFEADTDSEFGGYVLSNKRNDTQKSSVLNFSMNGKNSTNINDLEGWDNIDNKAKMKLSDVPLWNLKMEVGAGRADFDLSQFKVQKVEIDAGISKIDLKLGDKQALTKVDIEAGIASIDIDVPESVGCEFMSKGALNLKDIDELEKIEENLYRSKNYDSASKKIKIVYEGGLSTLKIRRY